MLRKKLEQQINDIRDPLLFKVIQHEGHALDRHLMSDEKLKRALWAMRKPKDCDDIVMETRFFSESQALNAIADSLQQNIDIIEKWLLSECFGRLEVTGNFTEATGDGLVKNTDWSKPILVHAVRVILEKNSCSVLRSFIVVTAYPIRCFDDNDAIYEAIDDFISKKNR